METTVLGTAALADTFACSGNSPTATTTYRLTGNAAGPLVVVLGGISASRHIAAIESDPTPGWWEAQVGSGRPLDTDRLAVLSLDWLGGPHRPLPANGSVTTADQARALAAILDSLGRERIDVLVGASYGGMVALAFAAAYPDRCDRLVILAAAHRSHPMATASRSLQRRIVQLARESGRAAEGLELARGLALTTYRSAAEFEQRFGGTPAARPAGTEHPVAAYLRDRGREFATRFDENAYLALSESIDTHWVDPRSIHAPTCLVSVATDTLVPPWLVEELRDQLAGPVVYRQIRARTGHDAFLTETAAVGEILREQLGEPPAALPHAATRAVRAAIGDDVYGAVMPPLYLSSNFTFAGLHGKRAYDYSRTANPTRDRLAEALAELEGGVGAVVTSSGMSAVAAVLHLLRSADRLLITHDCYGGTHRLVHALQRRGSFQAHFADLAGGDVEAIVASTRPRLIWVETPSNPLLRVTDLRRIAAAAREIGALVAVDNTLLSPVWQRPLEHGADIVVHSTTKFLNGHSDVIGGTAIAADAAVATELAWWSNCLGVTGAPFDSYLTLRGLRTLHARTRIHQDNAIELAALLQGHAAVQRVHYPGLPDDPGHALAARQQLGFGGLLSFQLRGGERSVRAFLNGLEHVSLAVSLGGVESLIAHPATMTHAAMNAAEQEAAGIGNSLLRLSVGIEAIEDLRRDLSAALNRAASVAR